MKKIIVITTGGTIASTIDPMTGRALSGKKTGEELLSKVNFEFKYDIELEIISLFQHPSNAMTFDFLFDLKNTIEMNAIREDVDGIVVTHGTDTLEESSYFLDILTKTNKSIVLTGAQRISSELGSDAYTNIRDSIYVSASNCMKDMGVNLVFNEKIYDPKFVKKDHTSNVNAFSGGVIGYVDRGDVKLITNKKVNKIHIKNEKNLPKVEIIKAYMEANPGMIRYLSEEEDCKGIVLEGLGRGHVPPCWIKSIQYAISKGKIVVLTSSCSEGRVYPAYEFPGSVASLEELGVISCDEMDSKKARILLSIQLADNKKITKETFIF